MRYEEYSAIDVHYQKADLIKYNQRDKRNDRSVLIVNEG